MGHPSYYHYAPTYTLTTMAGSNSSRGKKSRKGKSAKKSSGSGNKRSSTGSAVSKKDLASPNDADRSGKKTPQDFLDPKSTEKKTNWTEEEDDQLKELVEKHSEDWKLIAEALPESSSGKRTESQCETRWSQLQNKTGNDWDSPGDDSNYNKSASGTPITRGPWSEEEDSKVVDFVRRHGAKRWSVIAAQLPGRIGKQCRERWHNHLNPEISKEAWKESEDRIILECHISMGNKWAEIAKRLRGR